jgi:hypothetical protein
MAATNQYTTNQPQNAFLLDTQGFVQGLAEDDPVSRMWLTEGTLISTASVLMWGGVPITEQINVTGSNGDGLGPVVLAATSQADTTGWSTFQQMMHGIITPGSNAPTYGPTNSVGFFRAGTNVRLMVACDPALISTITGAGDAINSQSLYWDVTNYRITLTTSGGNFALPTSTRLLKVNSNSKIITYSSPNASWAAGAAAVILL